MAKLYYTEPTDKQFNELKEKAIEIWNTYDDTYGYATGKIDRIKGLQNLSDNFMTMVGMFDPVNQRKLAEMLTLNTRMAVHERIVDGGGSPMQSPFF